MPLSNLRLAPVAFIVLHVFVWQDVHVSAQTPTPSDANDAPAVTPAGGAADAVESVGTDGLGSEEAIGRFRQLLERRPLHATAFTGLVRPYVEQGTLAKLVEDYEATIAALPDNVSAKIVLARLYLRAGQPEKAAEIIERIPVLPTAFERDESKWLSFQAEVFQRVGRLDNALSVLTNAFEHAKTIAERMRLAEALADLHLRENQRDKASAVLVGLVPQFSDQYLHRKQVADALAQRDLHEAAVTQYREILQFPSLQPDERCETLRDLGRSLERSQRTQEAIDVYAEAVGLLSGGHWLHEELHERIVQLYRASGRMDDLVKYCREQITRAPEQTAMRSLLADVLATSGDVAGAKQTLAEAVELFPKDLTLSEKRIQLLERLEDDEGVAAEFERAIAQHAGDVELYIAYGQFLAAHKQLEAARNQWKHVLNTEVADVALATRLGALFEPYELYDDAVDCYERAVKLNPKQSDAYAALARLWFFRGEREKAQATLQRMADASPDDAAVHFAVAHAALGLGLNDEALTATERACALAPDQVDYQLARANLLAQVGRLEDSLAARRDVLERINNPVQQAQELNVLVSMFASAGKLADLRDAEVKRLDGNANNVIALLLLARAADFERDMPAAQKWLKQLLAIDPAHEETHRQLAKLYEALGDIDAAVEEYRRLVELHPARARQSYQAIADLKLRYDDRAGALETFEKMVQASPDNATVLKDVAEQLVRLGEYEQGLKEYEASLRLQPDRHEVRLAYAKALIDAGRLEDGLAAFKATALQRTDRESAAEALTKLHETALRLGMLDEVIDDLQTRLTTDPSDTAIARTLAALFIDEFEYNRAMELLDLVLRQQPRDAELLITRAELLRRLARFDEAVEGYRRLLRLPDVDRDFVLGELGKAYFEAGQLDPARAAWRQVGHKLYAASLLRNNGLLTEAVAVLEEGIRLKPDDYGLHRNLVRTLQAAGRTDDALEAARRLLDLEPDNLLNIRDLAKAYLDRGNRKAAAEIAARLFSAGVMEKNTSKGPIGNTQMGGSSVFAASVTAAGRGWFGSGGPKRNNLEAAVEFFMENGLLAELEETLQTQIAAQPDNAVLRETAVALFAESFGHPETALEILHELETASFPLEHQHWLGQCSQRDFFRVQQYQLIASKPGLRDQRLAVLEKRERDALTRDETLELAVIRQAQGQYDQAIDLLKQTAAADAADVVAIGALVDALMLAERYADAEPFVKSVIDQLGEQRERLRGEMIERVRRNFVRSLPLNLQLRVTEDLLADIAQKWTLGASFMSAFTGGVQTMGYHRARLTLATIYAKTERMDAARQLWEELAPKHPADVDGWTTLASVAQLHEQQDLAFRYYVNALAAAKRMVGDQLLQRIYATTTTQTWYGSSESIDTSFNKIVEAFAAHDQLVELYEFLRETDQTVKARRIADQYKLYDALKERYAGQVGDAQAEFVKTNTDSLERSVGYFAAVCKLAELHDQTGDWPEAERVYTRYLEDFPDELGLLTTLGEVAERMGDQDAAIAWETRAIVAKEHLLRQSRAWAQREVALLPAMPQVLKGGGMDDWRWSQRWGRNAWWGWGSGQRPLEIWPSWIRIAQLYVALENTIAAGDALERAIAAAGSDREAVGAQVLALIRSRQLVPQMLPVLRGLAVHLPTDQKVQIAFAESLAANERAPVAVEVYRRLLRRGVSDIGTLAQVRQQLATLAPGAEGAVATTVSDLEAQVQADPNNANDRLRLARAYYYSLRVPEALSALQELSKSAPHLEGVHDLLIEIYTLQDDSDHLVEALRTKIDRVQDARERQKARQRLVDELLRRGQRDEALTVLKELGDPKDPDSYQRIGFLLHYFGRHDEAIEQYELAKRSSSGGGWEGDPSGQMLARALALKGDLPAAADKVLESVDQQLRQNVQYGGMYAMYSLFNSEQNYFQPFTALFVLYPEMATRIEEKLEERQKANAADPQAMKSLMQFYTALGHKDRADALCEQLAGKGVADQDLTIRLIDRAAARHDYDRAIALATTFIEQQPKPQLPPGVPPQFAGMMNVMSARNIMLCKLGDLYWQMHRPEEAFSAYQRIVDESVDETRIAYAAICLMRDRLEEARTIVREALARQKVKSPALLQFNAILEAVDNQPANAFNALAEAAESGASTQNMFSYGDNGDQATLLASFAKQTGQTDLFKDFILNKRLAKDPNNWNDYRLLVQTLREAGRVDEAMKVLDRAAENKALRKQALQERVALLEGYADADQLIPLYQEWIGLAEKQVKPNVVQRFFGGGQSEEAVDTQRQRNRLGDLLWRSGDHAGAEKIWRERLNPNAAQSHVGLAERYLANEDEALARDAYSKAVALQPDNVPAQLALARINFQQGDLNEARSHLREVFIKRYQPAPPTEDGGDNDPALMIWNQSQNNQRQQASDQEMRTWAYVMSRTPTADADENSAAASEQREDEQLMLATLNGDWAGVETQLRSRLERAPFDPMVWSLWALTQERKGQWAEAAKARERVRRLADTTIAQRREQLELVLAGNQVNDAAAGTKDADAANTATASPAANMTRRYYPGYYDDGPTDRDTTQLAALYIELGQYDRAECLYLLSARQNAAYVLPTLAALMWRQGARERAVELYRLAVTLADGMQTIDDYATLLADSDQIDEAVDVLVGAYRCADRRQEGLISTIYGYGGYMNEEGFEANDEQQCSTALFRIMRRYGKFDDILKRISRESAEHAEDLPLARLLLSLQLQDRRWADARATLERCRTVNPFDLPLMRMEFQILVQLNEWAAAKALLAELRELAPKQLPRWQVWEAFVDLMQNEREKAVATVLPLLESADANDEVEPQQLCALLTAAGDHARLVQYLQGLQERDRLDDGTAALLVRALQLQGGQEGALRTALDRFWRQSPLRERTVWYRAVAEGTMALDSAAPMWAELTGADRALGVLVREGPVAGAAAFDEVIAENGDDVNARRGLVLAARMAGDSKRAIAANGALLDWLSSRRTQMWLVPKQAPASAVVKTFLNQSQGSGLNTTTVLGLSLSLGNMLQQMGGADPTAQPTSFDALWMAHQSEQGELLIWAGDLDAARGLLQAQAQAAESRQYANDPNRSRYTYTSYGPFGQSVSYWDDSGQIQGPTDDWRKAWRDRLYAARQFDALAQTYTELTNRVPAAEWNRRADACAALGKADDARTWRTQAAEAQLANLRAGDIPKLGDNSNRGYWWGNRSLSTEDTQRIRQSLRVDLPDYAREDLLPGQPYVFPPADSLYEFACIDEDIARRLENLADGVGSGWVDTGTVRQLQAYYSAKRQPEKVIDLLERVGPLELLMRSGQLRAYVQACFQTRDSARLEAVLKAALAQSASLEGDVLLARLMLLRHTQQDAEADALEQELLSRCRVESPNPCRADIRLNMAPTDEPIRQTFVQSRFRMGRYVRGPVRFGAQAMPPLATVAEFAAAVGVPYQPAVHEEDLTLEQVRQSYERHRLYLHAARILDMELAQDRTRSPRERTRLLAQRAYWLYSAGDKAGAAELARSMEEFWIKEGSQNPLDPVPSRELAGLYGSKAYGPDQEKALAALQAAKRLDPTFDCDGSWEALCLYELGRYSDAWKRYQNTLERSTQPLSGDILYRAGLASSHTDKAAAEPLLRQALWSDPFNKLAKDAREIVHE